MRTIWKYNLDITDIQTIEMPVDGKILSIQTQLGNICMWVEVNSSAPTTKRTFCVFGTGHEMPLYDRMTYLGTAQTANGKLVWHVFEKD